jgi:HK97 family phage portal protein
MANRLWSRLWPFQRKSAAADANAAILAALRAAWGGGASRSGVSITWETALQCTTALCVTRVLSQGLAQLPLKIFQQDGRNKIEALDHPVSRLVKRGPNGFQTWFEFVEFLMIHAVLGKGGFALILRDSQQRVIELLPLPSHWVTTKRRPDWSVYYQVDMTVASDGGTRRLIVEEADMFKIQGPSLDGYRGLAAGLDLAREALGLALATEEQHARLHSNGLQTSGAWSVDGILAADQYEQLSAVIEKKIGLAQAHRPLILDRAAKFQPFGMTGVDAEHLATRSFQIEEVCRALRCMPIMVGHNDKAATYASAEQMFLAHETHDLVPWGIRFEQRVARCLLTPEEMDDGLYSKIMFQARLRGDPKSRAEFYQRGIVDGWLGRNEARAFEDMNPIDGLDEMLSPLNMVLGNPPPAEPAPPALTPPA